MTSITLRYFFTYTSCSKARWINRKLLDVMIEEFKEFDIDYCKKAIELGVISVNRKKVDLNYCLKASDKIYHTIHRHEPIQKEIEIIHEDENFLVVNKPFGVACHPCNSYFFCTITETLKNKYGSLGCINRLDVPVSGIVLLSRNGYNLFHEKMSKKEINKKYLALVRGYFEDQTVNTKLKVIPSKGVIISEDGKEAKTIFKRLKYHNGYSLIECSPLTGRRHQIRVHLSSIGFPIVGDTMYGQQDKTDDKEEVIKCDGTCNIEMKKFVFSKDDTDSTEKKEYMSFIIENCKANNINAIKQHNVVLHLHAQEYTVEGKTFVATAPEWTDIEKFLENYKTQ